MLDNSRTLRIRAFNDTFRTLRAGGRIMLTQGIVALGREAQERLFLSIAAYNDWDEANDPYGEHDFGLVTVDGVEVIFKIDYYDSALEYGSPDPADPAVTSRVMTIMRAEEY